MADAAQVFSSSDISVVDYRCKLGPADQPFPEVHRCFSLAYVRKGSFGCRTGGRTFELVAGSILVGHPGNEYTCSHEHHVCGDECLSFQFTSDLVEPLGAMKAWRVGAMPPLASLIIVGELAQAAVEKKSDLSLDEIGMMLAARIRRCRLRREQQARSLRPRAPPCSRGGTLDQRTCARADRSRGDRAALRPKSVSFSAQLCQNDRRHATPISRALPLAAGGPTPRRARARDYRYRVGLRLQRPVELHSHLPPCRRHVAARLPPRLQRRPQESPRTARRACVRLASNTEVIHVRSRWFAGEESRYERAFL